MVALALAALGVAGETAGPAGIAPAAQTPAVAGAARRLQWEVVRSGPHDPQGDLTPVGHQQPTQHPHAVSLAQRYPSVSSRRPSTTSSRATLIT